MISQKTRRFKKEEKKMRERSKIFDFIKDFFDFVNKLKILQVKILIRNFPAKKLFA